MSRRVSDPQPPGTGTPTFEELKSRTLLNPDRPLTDATTLEQRIALTLLHMEKAKAILVALHTGAEDRPPLPALTDRYNAVYVASVQLRSVYLLLDEIASDLREEIEALREAIR